MLRNIRIPHAATLFSFRALEAIMEVWVNIVKTFSAYKIPILILKRLVLGIPDLDML
jgi:hypothetical protein